MNVDVIDQAIEAARDAWAEADSELPKDDPDWRSAVLTAIDTGILELEEAKRLAGATPVE